MTYTQNPTWNSGAGPGIDAGALNNLETEYQEASLSYNPDLFTAGFVVSGLTCTIDGGNASQLDIASGTAYVLQAADSTLRQRKISSTNKTASVINTTYYLDLNPDGTLSWATSHSGTPNYVPICSVTTDASHHLVTITDARPLNASIMPNMAGQLVLPNAQYVSKTGDTLTGALTITSQTNSTAPLTGRLPSSPSGDQSVISGAVNGDTTNRISQYIRNADGYGGLRGGAGTSTTAHLYAQSGGWKIDESLTVSGSISGAVGTAVPTTRNGSALSAEMYTGTSTPSGDGVTTPRTGAIWIKA